MACPHTHGFQDADGLGLFQDDYEENGYELNYEDNLRSMIYLD